MLLHVPKICVVYPYRTIEQQNPANCLMLFTIATKMATSITGLLPTEVHVGVSFKPYEFTTSIEISEGFSYLEISFQLFFII